MYAGRSLHCSSRSLGEALITPLLVRLICVGGGQTAVTLITRGQVHAFAGHVNASLTCGQASTGCLCVELSSSTRLHPSLSVPSPPFDLAIGRGHVSRKLSPSMFHIQRYYRLIRYLMYFGETEAQGTCLGLSNRSTSVRKPGNSIFRLGLLIHDNNNNCSLLILARTLY